MSLRSWLIVLAICAAAVLAFMLAFPGGEPACVLDDPPCRPGR